MRNSPAGLLAGTSGPTMPRLFVRSTPSYSVVLSRTHVAGRMLYPALALSTYRPFCPCSSALDPTHCSPTRLEARSSATRRPISVSIAPNSAANATSASSGTHGNGVASLRPRERPCCRAGRTAGSATRGRIVLRPSDRVKTVWRQDSVMVALGPPSALSSPRTACYPGGRNGSRNSGANPPTPFVRARAGRSTGRFERPDLPGLAPQAVVDAAVAPGDGGARRARRPRSDPDRATAVPRLLVVF